MRTKSVQKMLQKPILKTGVHSRWPVEDVNIRDSQLALRHEIEQFPDIVMHDPVYCRSRLGIGSNDFIIRINVKIVHVIQENPDDLSNLSI